MVRLIINHRKQIDTIKNSRRLIDSCPQIIRLTQRSKQMFSWQVWWFLVSINGFIIHFSLILSFLSPIIDMEYENIRYISFNRNSEVSLYVSITNRCMMSMHEISKKKERSFDINYKIVSSHTYHNDDCILLLRLILQSLKQVNKNNDFSTCFD